MAERLAIGLRTQGFDRGTAEDAVQETAVRVITSGVAFADAEDLLRWARVVARNVAIDMVRRRRHVPVAAVPDRADPTDVEVEVLGRRRVAALPDAVRLLTPAERAALATGPAEGVARVERQRHAVRLHRARRHLMALVETLAGLLGLLARARPRVRVALAAAVPISVLFVVTMAVRHNGASQSPEFLRPNTTEIAREQRTLSTSAQAQEPGQAAAPALARGPAPAVRPVVHVVLPRPDGGGIGAGVRPKDPDDHLACLNTAVSGWTCLDLPVSVTH